MIHPEILKFWSGEGISFFEMENVVPDHTNGRWLDGYKHMYYCRSTKTSEYGSTYIVIAKTVPYFIGKRPKNYKYERFFFDRISHENFGKDYSEKEILKLIKLKMFI